MSNVILINHEVCSPNALFDENPWPHRQFDLILLSFIFISYLFCFYFTAILFYFALFIAYFLSFLCYIYFMSFSFRSNTMDITNFPMRILGHNSYHVSEISSRSFLTKINLSWKCFFLICLFCLFWFLFIFFTGEMRRSGSWWTERFERNSWG